MKAFKKGGIYPWFIDDFERKTSGCFNRKTEEYL